MHLIIDVIITAEDVEKHKPDKKPLIKTMERLNKKRPHVTGTHVTGTHVTGTHVTGTGLLTLFWFKSKIIDFHIITPYIYYCSNYNIISDVFNARLISSDAQNLNTSHTHGLY
ncbi:HAD hydrolase-like protein [Sedimentibacter sp.]|uniref:HAD hydrolase-like protein n=1 Tax=Sedimentibacter sp. TaxID=1960295 RepID=UPI0037DA310F